jgi:[acyl-carrier-protein] S-malonyltransferase
MKAFVFPGQGSQYVGMGREFYEEFPTAKRTFDEGSEALGFDIAKLCFEGDAEQLRLTANTQPAILTVSVATWRVLDEETGTAADFAAGHSLGEYSALVASGALDFKDAAWVVRKRGEFMQDAVPDGAKRVVLLEVSAPFHCALMVSVAQRLEEVLSEVRVRELQTPVIPNFDAKPNKDSSRVKKLLIDQVANPVRWDESVKMLYDLGVREFLEIGPGNVLSGLIKRTVSNVSVLNLEKIDHLRSLKERWNLEIK